MNILDKIVAEKRREVGSGKKRTAETALRSKAAARTDFRDFKAVLRKRDGVSLIAEVKKASPSVGLISKDFDPVNIATRYEQAGASACSVLTDETFFQGHLDFLRQIRGATRMPLLRKDFIIDEYQIYEASIAGADAILLIVAILDPEQLTRYLVIAKENRLAALVEIHDGEGMERALKAGAEIIGINNRNLKDFSVDLGTTERLAAQIRQRESQITPARRGGNHELPITLVAESGIHTRADVERVRAAGVDAILVGESLMRSADIAGKVKELVG